MVVNVVFVATILLNHNHDVMKLVVDMAMELLAGNMLWDRYEPLYCFGLGIISTNVKNASLFIINYFISSFRKYQ